jgi:hypothetical protein
MLNKFRFIAVVIVATVAAFLGGTVSGTIQAQAVTAQTFTIKAMGTDCNDGYKSSLIYDYYETSSANCYFDVKVSQPKIKRVIQLQYYYNGAWTNGAAAVTTSSSTGKAKVVPWKESYDEDLEEFSWAEGTYVYRLYSAKTSTQKAWASSNFVIEFTPEPVEEELDTDEYGCTEDEYWDDYDEACYPLY